MTDHKCKLPDVKRSGKDAQTTCSCGKTYRSVRYTCSCGTFGCRDAWQWVGIIDPPQAEPLAEPETVEDDAAE